MQQQVHTVDPGQVLQSLLQARMEVYRQQENLFAAMKVLNERTDSAMSLVEIMKNRILQFENDSQRETVPGVSAAEAKQPV